MKKQILVVIGMTVLIAACGKSPNIEDTVSLPATVSVPSLPQTVVPSPTPSPTPTISSVAVKEPSPVLVQHPWMLLEGVFKHRSTSCGSVAKEAANSTMLVFNNSELEKWEPRTACGNNVAMVSKSYVIYDLTKMSQTVTHTYNYTNQYDCTYPKAEDAALKPLSTNEFVLKDNVLTIYSNDNCDGKGTRTTTVYKRPTVGDMF